MHIFLSSTYAAHHVSVVHILKGVFLCKGS
nr:MAG TPA: hypothetical protein [Microviridae sp.]